MLPFGPPRAAREPDLDDVWIPITLRLRGAHVVFAEDAIAYDQAFADEREFGRKVRTLAGDFQLFSMMAGRRSLGSAS